MAISDNAISDNHESDNEPRIVKLISRKRSFGFKVRGQVNQGGPRWLINGKEYKNLQTVSEVSPESAANDGGVLPGDKILSINGKEIEGIEHEEFKELMKNSGDEVELIVITPNEAKMLDIPSSVTIHRSDGSTLTINDPDVLRSQNIDQAIQSAEKAKPVSVLPHSTIVEINPVEAWAGDSEPPDQDAEVATSDKDDSAEVQEEDEKENEDELNVSIEIGDLPEESELPGQTDIAEEDIKQDAEESDLEDNSTNVEDSSTIINIDNVAETSFIEPDMKCEDSHENEDSGRDSFLSEKNMSTNESESSRKQVKRRSQKRFLPKRPKVQPFSPDVFNDLSPYYSRIKIKSFEIEQRPARSWKYNQRPTSLSVLDPSDAFRLEGENSRRDFTAWSSNFTRRRANGSEIAEDEATARLRQDVYNIYKSVESRNERNGHRRTSEKKMSGLSQARVYAI